MNLEKRIKQLKQTGTQAPGILAQVGMNAALRAVEKAAGGAPPTVNNLRGTSTYTGEMKQHWATDGRPRPIRRGDSYVSELNSDKQYASFVDDGHWMGRHFVPGLVINPGSGLLEFNLDRTGGIVIGIQVTYALGLFMVDKAVGEYRRVLREGLKELKELMG